MIVKQTVKPDRQHIRIPIVQEFAKMLQYTILITALLPRILAWPAPAGIERRQQPSATAVPPAGSSGFLRSSDDLAGYSPSNPLDKQETQIAPSDFELGPGQDANAELGLYLDLSDVENPRPLRGTGDGPSDPGPRNEELDRQNPDLFAPPGTDSGDVPNAKWPLGLSHNATVSDQPDGRASRMLMSCQLPRPWQAELHWHKANEWSIILNGPVRVAAVDEEGRTFVDDLQAGDVWFFPKGIPHSIQAFEDGAEFLLVFDDGAFSEDETFLVSELFEGSPKSVLAKDLRVDTSAFDHIPDGELYIFEGTPAPSNITKQNITGPAGVIPHSRTYSYHFSQQQPLEVPGGSVKVLDPLTFPQAANFATALFTVKPGAMRELHWHTSSDEWTYFISGQGRLTAYVAPESSRTFDFQAGDTGYVPVPVAHYLENTGTEDLVYLEVLQAGVYNDISVAQWLGLTPKQVVKDHLGFSEDTMDRLPKVKPFIVPGDTNLLQTDFMEERE